MYKRQALNSVYQGHEHIQKEDITEALLQVVYKLQKTDKETDSTELQKIAVHEAAHAVVGEVLHQMCIRDSPFSVVCSKFVADL